MSLRRVLVFAAACHVLGGVRTLSAQPEGVFTEDGRVRIRNQTLGFFSDEKLQRCGLTPPDIAPDQNAAWLYVQAINSLQDIPPELSEALDAASGGSWPEGEAGDKLLAYLEENRAPLELVRQASQMPDYYLPLLRDETDMLIAGLLPTLAPTRQFAKMLSAEATLKAMRGDGAGAVTDVLTVKRMANQVGGGSTLIEGLVGLACSSLADRTMTALAERGALDAGTLKEAVGQMDELRRKSPSFEEMIQGERAWELSVIDDVMDIPGAFSFVNGGDFVEPAQDGWTILRGALMRVYMPDRAMKRHISDHFDRLVEDSRADEGRGYGERQDTERLAHVPAWDVVTRMIIPSLSRANELVIRGRSNALRAQLRVAVEAYKLDKGVYPPALESMVPEYISEAPIDPATGHMFPYAVQNADRRPAGLEMITRDNEAEIMKKRQEPVIELPRTSNWRRYVSSYADSHGFSESQRSSAEAILRELEGRAASIERSLGREVRAQIEKGDIEGAKKKLAPVDELYRELQRRMESLTTARQRQIGDGKR